MEITQFTYFQEVGGVTLEPISVELTYGLERLALYLQDVESVYDLEWGAGIKYGEIYQTAEAQFSQFNFERADTKRLTTAFEAHERESNLLLDAEGGQPPLVQPAYDEVLAMSHLFNLLDARGALSVTERARYIGRVRALARRCALGYVELRQSLGFPLTAKASRKTAGRRRG